MSSFPFSITLSSKHLCWSSTTAAVLSLDAAFQIVRQRSGGMISGDPLIYLYQESFILSSGSSLPMHTLSTNRRVISNSAIEAAPGLYRAPASPPRCPHLISHGFPIRLKRLQYWLCGRGSPAFPSAQSSPSLFAVSLLMWGNRSAHSLTRWAGVKCPNASLTNVLSLNDSSITVALWTCP